MPVLAGSVIDAARSRNAAFVKERHPNKAALSILSAYAKKLHGKILGIDPDQLRVEIAVSLPLADFDGGIPLPANTRQVVEIAAGYPVDQGREPFPVTLIDSHARNAYNAPRGAAWQIGNTLYFRGPSTIWNQFTQFGIAVVMLPAPLTTLDDVLPVPDAAEEACTEAVALHFAMREAQEEDTKISLQLFAGIAKQAEDDYLDTVRSAFSGKTFFTQDVWRP